MFCSTKDNYQLSVFGTACISNLTCGFVDLAQRETSFIDAPASS